MQVQDLFSLSGRVALVTGGSRGLGRAMVRAFAEAGADVVIVSRKLSACQALADEIAAETGQRALALACHVGHWEELDQLVESAYDKFDRIDVLVNNAGMSPLYENLLDVTEDLYDKVMDVNLKGPFRLTALVGSKMINGGGGSIVNVSSASAFNPRPHLLPYAAAKGALNVFTVGFSRAFGPKVRVNGIMPGPFLTDISKAWDIDEFQRRARSFSLQRGGRDEEIVGTALYLASDASSFTTGTVVTVDGGAT